MNSVGGNAGGSEHGGQGECEHLDGKLGEEGAKLKDWSGASSKGIECCLLGISSALLHPLYKRLSLSGTNIRR